jgi:methylmalonyl-CoA mutase N-terminal domain/subunit
MPLLVDCARARVSEGEMVRAMQSVFGTYTETPVY